jgi:hypothetical protein
MHFAGDSLVIPSFGFRRHTAFRHVSMTMHNRGMIIRFDT